MVGSPPRWEECHRAGYLVPSRSDRRSLLFTSPVTHRISLFRFSECATYLQLTRGQDPLHVHSRVVVWNGCNVRNSERDGAHLLQLAEGPAAVSSVSPR